MKNKLVVLSAAIAMAFASCDDGKPEKLAKDMSQGDFVWLMLAAGAISGVLSSHTCNCKDKRP